MKKYILVALFLVFCLTSVSYGAEKKTFKEFIAGLRKVESNGNDRAVGDNGNAVGAFQIWEACWKDAVEFDRLKGGIYGIKDGTYQDCFKYEYAVNVVCAYLDRYAWNAVENGDWETCARRWNGGPRGDKNAATLKYWAKVKKAMGIK